MNEWSKKKKKTMNKTEMNRKYSKRQRPEDRLLFFLCVLCALWTLPWHFSLSSLAHVCVCVNCRKEEIFAMITIARMRNTNIPEFLVANKYQRDIVCMIQFVLDFSPMCSAYNSKWAKTSYALVCLVFADAYVIANARSLLFLIFIIF